MKRNSLEIMKSILEYCKDGKIITHISNHSNLSHADAKRHIDKLSLLKLIHKREEKYFTSDEGYFYLKTYEDLIEIIN